MLFQILFVSAYEIQNALATSEKDSISLVVVQWNHILLGIMLESQNPNCPWSYFMLHMKGRVPILCYHRILQMLLLVLLASSFFVRASLLSLVITFLLEECLHSHGHILF